MKARLVLILVVLGLVAFGVSLSRKVSARLDKLAAVDAEAKVRAGAAPVHPDVPLVQPQPGPTLEKLRLTGTLRPEAEVELGFKLPGRVLELGARRGDVVRAGHELARLNDRDLEAQAAQARAGLQAARAQKAMASDALKRSSALREAGAASDQQVMMAGGQQDLGSASMAQAEATGRLVDAMRLETKLVAPIDGVVVRAPTAAGFFAAPGVPIFRIEKLTNLRFSGHLADRDAVRVQKGSRLHVKSDAGIEVDGTLDAIIPSADPMTRRVPIEGLLPNPDGKLFAGGFVDATIEVTAEPTLRIPATALVTGEGAAVLVVGAEDKLERRAVEVARTDGEDLLVRKGLSATDRVVSRPGTTWRAGDRLPTQTAKQ